MSARWSLIDSCTHRRAAFAAKFLKPPGRFKRAELRDKPRGKIGEFENPVRKFVRLREKARQFSLIPPPRRIPIPRGISHKFLSSIEGVPSVSDEALNLRLNFLLSENAKLQQMSYKLRPGLTPFQAELFMWERQMRDLRKIYRAQYLKKLQEVTEEERFKQLQLYIQEKKDRQKTRRAIRSRNYEDKKRKSILKDRMRIEQRVTMSLQFARQSRRKKANLYWFLKLQKKMDVIDESNIEHELGDKTNKILTRNISVPQILRQLGHAETNEKSVKKKIIGTENVFRNIMEESFAILAEDEPQFDNNFGVDKNLESNCERQKAYISYSSFTDEEKLKLLDEKIEIISRRIEQETLISNSPQNLQLIHLKQHLEAARIAFSEKKDEEEARKNINISKEKDYSEK